MNAEQCLFVLGDLSWNTLKLTEKLHIITKQKIFFFQDHWRVSCLSDAYSPSNTQWVVPTSKDIPSLDNHNTTIKPRKLTLTYYCHLMLISYSCFPNCLSITFYIKRTTYDIYLLCLFNVIYSRIFPSLALALTILAFLKTVVV